MKTLSRLHYCESLNLDCNKPRLDDQEAKLCYSKALRSTKEPLKTHDRYFSLCPVYAPSLQRDVETCTSARSRHYIAKSYGHIQHLLNTQQYFKLVTFLFETVYEILKQECRTLGVTEYLHAEFTVLLDSCVALGVINESIHSSLMHLHLIYTSAYPAIGFSKLTGVSQLVKSNCWGFSSLGKIENTGTRRADISQEDAARCLGIVHDFLAANTAAHGDQRFEPYLSLTQSQSQSQSDA